MTRSSIRLSLIGCGSILALLVLACSLQVGSKAWGGKMSDIPKGDWSANEATDYAKHCMFE